MGAPARHSPQKELASQVGHTSFNYHLVCWQPDFEEVVKNKYFTLLGKGWDKIAVPLFNFQHDKSLLLAVLGAVHILRQPGEGGGLGGHFVNVF